MLINQTKRQSFYLPELDGLRFIAFFLVFLNHAPFIYDNAFSKALHEYGWLGVDLFLCLSAFLITKLLLGEYDLNQRINVRWFYLRRILRIWPLYFTMIATVVLFSWLEQGWNLTFSYRLFGMITFTDNILAALIGYNHLAFAPHLWTISYEEQFYAIIPWVLRKLAQATRTTQTMFFGVLLIAGNFLRALLIYFQAKHPAIWVLPFTHFESILGGLALGIGIFEVRLNKISPRILFLIGISCIALVFFLPNTEITGWHLMLTYPLTGAGMSLILYSSTKQEIPVFHRLITNKLAVYLGKISYGLYVFHLASLLIANQICTLLRIQTTQTLLYPISMSFTAILLVVMLSIASYQLLEKPFLQAKDSFTFIASRPV